MADEMARRMAEDQAFQDTGAVPGNGQGQPETAPPAAGPSTTDTGAGRGTPDTIPYARFKEVNDRLGELRGYEQLSELGYDPDSLGRLAAFEAAWLRDPYGTWGTMAANLDLPQELKGAIEAHLTGLAEGEPSGDGEATPELPADVRERLEYVDRLKAEREDADRTAQVNAIVDHWNELDKKDGIETPKIMQLMAISAAAGSGQQFRTLEDLALAARAPIVDYRESTLGSAIQRTVSGGSPRPLPGSAPVPAEPVRFTDIKQATKAAAAAIERGELPGV